MKLFSCSISFFLSFLCYSQNVFEYSSSSKLSFKVYDEDEGRYYKISKDKDFKQDSPEDVALSSFFAYSNDIASKLYLKKENYFSRDKEDFEGIKKTKDSDAYIQLLHKTQYRLDGNDLCYIMFIAKIKGTDFPFPTLLSLIKKSSKWYIYNRPNQEKLTKSLKILKPCVLSNIIEGASTDKDINSLISKTKSNFSGIDFSKLFDELAVLKSNNRTLFNKLTMSQNANCNIFDYKKNVASNNTITAVLKNVSIQKIRKQDSELVAKIKQSNDSIVLTNKLEFEYSGGKYYVVKYNEIGINGDIVKKNYKSFNKQFESPLKELVFMYESLVPKVFKDLSPSLREKPFQKEVLYKNTRGVYGVLNISKMYDMFINNKILFKDYIY